LHSELYSEDMQTYNLDKRTGIIKYARKFLLRGCTYAGIGIIGIVQLSARCFTVRAVTTQAASASGFRDFTAPIL